MPVSQNDWPASPDPAELGVEPCTVAGVPIGDGLKAGAVTTVLGYVLAELHRRVEPLVAGWCWGYKYRPIAGTETLSNHASGTAVDVNAPDHPRFYRGTFSPDQMSEINQILADVDGVVRWGGDYRGVPDEMHFEINAGEAAVAAVAERLERRMQILDYSAGYPGALHIQRLGYGGVIRYLRKEGTSSVRPLTVAEVADMRAYGLAVALVYQHVSKSRVTEGRAAGRHDAEWALAQARAVGIEPRVIYLAVDFDADPASVVEYFIGVGEVLGVQRVGGYGGYRVLAHLFNLGLISKGWQTVAWSAGRRESRAHLFQRVGYVYPGGIQCDVNDVLKDDYGQHPAPSEEDDMTPEQAATLTYLGKFAYALQQGLDNIPEGDWPNSGAPIQLARTIGGQAWRTEGLANARDAVAGGEDAGKEIPFVALLKRLVADVAELKARQPADVDEAALAAELEKRGWDPATAAEVKQIVLGAFARAGQPEGSNS